MFTMPRKGIVNVKMVITEEKILSNIEKVHRIINPDSKKQIIELDDNSYFKDLIESIKTYLIEYPKKKNFPKSVYDAAFSLVEYATEQFDANTKKVESLIKQREINTKLGAILKQTLAIIQTPNAEWQKAIINVQNRYPAEIISALNVVGFENGKPEKSAKYKEAVKLINARVSNLETNLHIEIDLERIEDKSKALSYIGIEIADALKTIPTPRNSESIESIEQPMVEEIEEVKNEVVEQPIIEQPVTVVEQPVQVTPVPEIKEQPVEIAVEDEMAKFDIPQVTQISTQPQIQPQIQPQVQQMQVNVPVSEPVQAVETPAQAPRRVTAADIAAAQRELMAEEMQRRQTVQKAAPQQARVPQQLNVPRYGQVINPQRQIERQQVAQMQQQRIQQQRQAQQAQQAQRQAVAPQQSVYENHVAETTKEVKPSLWQRFKKTKFARAFSYLFKVRVVLQLPEGQEDQSR